MSFKNAFKIFISRFALVWVLALYLAVVMLLVVLVALPFILIITNTLSESGIVQQVQATYDNLLNGATLQTVFQEAKAIFEQFLEMFRTNATLSVTSTLLFTIVLGIVFRFFFGLYEIPLTKVLENYMSSNAKSGFTANFISSLKKSSLFSITSFIYTVAADAIILLTLNLLFKLFGVPVLSIFTPFIIMIVLIVLLSLKSTFISMWSAYIIIDGQPLFKALALSFKKTGKHFTNIFGSFLISWILIIALNVFVGIFTFGAGLLATIPISMLFFRILNVTIFYNKNNKRYYIDETVFTPPEIAE